MKKQNNEINEIEEVIFNNELWAFETNDCKTCEKKGNCASCEFMKKRIRSVATTLYDFGYRNKKNGEKMYIIVDQNQSVGIIQCKTPYVKCFASEEEAEKEVNRLDEKSKAKGWGDVFYYVAVKGEKMKTSKVVEKENIENVSHPSHYTDGKIEVIDYILDKHFDFCLGNVIKYVSRAGKKKGNSYLSDLKKARQYIEFAISAAETEKNEN